MQTYKNNLKSTSLLTNNKKNNFNLISQNFLNKK